MLDNTMTYLSNYGIKTGINLMPYEENKLMEKPTFIKEVAGILQKSGYTKKRALYRCSCGREFVSRMDHMKGEKVKSCGCIKKEIAKQNARTTHGMTANKARPRIYRIWYNLKNRVLKPECKQYNSYGGRGIDADPRWLGENGFINFHNDIGDIPDDMTLERIDNNKGYWKDNIRLATPFEQARNRRTNKLIEYKGEIKIAEDWALWGSKEYKIPYGTILSRIGRGWPIDRALTEPINDNHFITLNGKTQHLAAWAKEYGMTPWCLSNRLQLGWSIERAITKPLDRKIKQ